MWRLASSARRLVSAKCFARLGARRGGARRSPEGRGRSGAEAGSYTGAGRSFHIWVVAKYILLLLASPGKYETTGPLTCRR